MIEAAFRTDAGTPVAAVTAEEMRDVDRVAIEDLGIDLLQMMENAGRTLARRVLAAAPDGDRPVLVVAGNGGNGGGGLACARHLSNRGVDVRAVVDRPPTDLDGAARQQRDLLEWMGVPMEDGADAFDAAPTPGVVVDALIGYGLGGAVRGEARSLVEAVNATPATTVSLDVPSGRDATTGERLGAAVDADRIVTLALPKTGLVDVDPAPCLADISVPAPVYERLDVPYENPFGRSHWVDLHRADPGAGDPGDRAGFDPSSVTRSRLR